MDAVYAIEYFDGGRLSCTRVVAGSMALAVQEFETEHPGCEAVEVRKDHVLRT